MKHTAYWLLLFALFLSAQLRAQGEFNNWYFGYQSGLTFANGSPTPVPASSITSTEGISSISDAAGNLLFYTNGQTIWNREHAVMPNGSGILGDPSSTQGTLIIPIPESRKYYLFTVGAQERQVGDLRYTIIDMALDNGLGDVEDASKNIWISNNNTEKLVSATAANCGYWLITHKKNAAEFEARRITTAGIGLPVSSITGSIHNYPVGNMKMSHDDLKVAVAVSTVPGYVELFDFDNITGQLSNPIRLDLLPNATAFGICFSPDNSMLYVSEGFLGTNLNFYQYDLSVYDEAAINASQYLIGSSFCGDITYSVSDLQMGPDGVIYFTRPLMTCIGAIPFPNEKAPFSGFDASAYCFGKPVGICLPNSIRAQPNLLAFTLGRDTAICQGSSLQLTAPNFSPHFLWSTGATTPGISVQDAGRYWVRLGTGNCTASDTIVVSYLHTQVKLRSDTVICPGSPVALDAGNFAAFAWSTGAVTRNITVTQPGVYWVEVTDICGARSRDSVLLTEAVFNYSLGPDREICPGGTVTLALPGPFSGFTWGPAYEIIREFGASIDVSPAVDTSYYVEATISPGCYVRDTVQVIVTSGRQVNLGSDTTFCAGSVLRIEAGSGFTDYKWHDGSSRPFLETKQRGEIWVEVRNSTGCISRDTVTASWSPCGQALWMPNAFTPNGDGKNDVFRPGYKGYFEQYQLTIYDRWGSVVFRSADADAGWNGNQLNTGVFVWVCRYQFFGDDSRVQTGTLTLIR